MIDNPPDDASGSAPDKVPDSIAAQPLGVGATLREARTRLGMSVADVASHLKFAPRQIEALEEDNFASLPETAFVRGFVRSYAKLLHLAPAPLLAALPGAVVQPAPPSANTLGEVPFPSIYAARKPNIIWLAAALVVAIALAIFSWLHGSAPSVPSTPHVETLALPAALPVSAIPDAEIMKAPQVAAPKVQQVAAPKVQQVAAPKVQQVAAPKVQQDAALLAKPIAKPTTNPIANPTTKPTTNPIATNGASEQAAAIRLVFDEESWAEVTGKDGKILLSQLNPHGSEQSVKGKPPFSITIGRASGVRLYYKGQAVNLASHTKAEVAHLTLE